MHSHVATNLQEYVYKCDHFTNTKHTTGPLCPPRDMESRVRSSFNRKCYNPTNVTCLDSRFKAASLLQGSFFKQCWVIKLLSQLFYPAVFSQRKEGLKRIRLRINGDLGSNPSRTITRWRGGLVLKVERGKKESTLSCTACRSCLYGSTVFEMKSDGVVIICRNESIEWVIGQIASADNYVDIFMLFIKNWFE